MLHFEKRNCLGAQEIPEGAEIGVFVAEDCFVDGSDLYTFVSSSVYGEVQTTRIYDAEELKSIGLAFLEAAAVLQKLQIQKEKGLAVADSR